MKSSVLESIWIKESKRGAMDPVESADAVKDIGLVGNADQGGRRQVTVIEKEVFDQIRDRMGPEIDPVMRRANLMISGLRLEESKGRTLKIGELALKIEGETKPCSRMDQAFPGLREALIPHWGGGVYGVVLNNATISRGDPVSWTE